MAVDPSWLTGANGGLMAMAFGAGAAAGYGFAARTLLRAAQERIAEFRIVLRDQRSDFESQIATERNARSGEAVECRAEITSLKGELAQLRQMLIGRPLAGEGGGHG